MASAVAVSSSSSGGSASCVVVVDEAKKEGDAMAETRGQNGSFVYRKSNKFIFFHQINMKSVSRQLLVDALGLVMIREFFKLLRFFKNIKGEYFSENIRHGGVRAKYTRACVILHELSLSSLTPKLLDTPKINKSMETPLQPSFIV